MRVPENTIRIAIFLLAAFCAAFLSNCGSDECDCPETGDLFTATVPMTGADTYGADGESHPLPFGMFEATAMTSPAAMVIEYRHDGGAVTTTVRYRVLPDAN